MTAFSFRPAKRENVPLLIGLAGGTGSGKTMTALLLAKGLANGKRFAVIDTEAGRAKHYADMFNFDHGDLGPPFRPERYADAIKAADAEHYPVIVVDSASHEYAGDGGILDWHEDELQRMAGDDYKRREALTFAAWVKPKMEHKRFVSQLLQIRAHLILCFRAEEKIEIVREGGKTKVQPKRTRTGLDGWVPLSEKSLPFELTISCLFTADAPGVPKPIKLEEQFKPFLPLDKPVTEQTGAQLGKWAAGGATPESAEPTPEIAGLTDELLELGEKLGKAEQTAAAITEHRDRHKPVVHARWLKTQVEHAQAKVAEAESLFAGESV